MKILNFGSCNIDYVYSLDHIVLNGETQSAQGMQTFAGGKGLNQSLSLARAGANVYHAGCIGQDGGMLRDILDESGVDTSYLHCVDCKNGHAIIQVSDKGDNCIIICAGSNACIDESLVDSVLSDFGEGDIVVLQNEISCVPYIIEKAYEKGMCVVFNPSPIDATVLSIDLGKLSYVLLNETEARQISGADSAEQALELLCGRYPKLKIVLTLGARGCIFAFGDKRVRQAAFEAQVVDTTAAGDTFTGYFVTQISRGESCERAIRVASAASAIAISRKGAAPSVPYADEVLSKLATMKEIDN